MNEAVSAPDRAKAMVDHTIMCCQSNVGTKADAGIGVAEPNCHQAMVPITITASAGSHMPTAPRLCSHRPKRRPTMLTTVMNSSAIREKVMKNSGLLRRNSQRVPPMYSALPASK